MSQFKCTIKAVVPRMKTFLAEVSICAVAAHTLEASFNWVGRDKFVNISGFHHFDSRIDYQLDTPAQCEFYQSSNDPFQVSWMIQRQTNKKGNNYKREPNNLLLYLK